MPPRKTRVVKTGKRKFTKYKLVNPRGVRGSGYYKPLGTRKTRKTARRL